MEEKKESEKKQITREMIRKERLGRRARDREHRISAEAMMREAEKIEKEADNAVKKMLEEELAQVAAAEEETLKAKSERDETQRLAIAEKAVMAVREEEMKKQHFKECLGAQIVAVERAMVVAVIMSALNTVAISIVMTLAAPFYILAAVIVSAWEWIAVAVVTYLMLSVWEVYWKKKGYEPEIYDPKLYEPELDRNLNPEPLDLGDME